MANRISQDGYPVYGQIFFATRSEIWPSFCYLVGDLTKFLSYSRIFDQAFFVIQSDIWPCFSYPVEDLTMFSLSGRIFVQITGIYQMHGYLQNLLILNVSARKSLWMNGSQGTLSSSDVLQPVPLFLCNTRWMLSYISADK